MTFSDSKYLNRFFLVFTQKRTSKQALIVFISVSNIIVYTTLYYKELRNKKIIMKTGKFVFFVPMENKTKWKVNSCKIFRPNNTIIGILQVLLGSA